MNFKTQEDMHMVIDEQNIATDADYTLDGYLNQQLNVLNPICNHFDVTYVDSKYHPLVQFILNYSRNNSINR